MVTATNKSNFDNKKIQAQTNFSRFSKLQGKSCCVLALVETDYTFEN